MYMYMYTCMYMYVHGSPFYMYNVHRIDHFSLIRMFIHCVVS